MSLRREEHLELALSLRALGMSAMIIPSPSDTAAVSRVGLGLWACVWASAQRFRGCAPKANKSEPCETARAAHGAAGAARALGRRCAGGGPHGDGAHLRKDLFPS